MESFAGKSANQQISRASAPAVASRAGKPGKLQMPLPRSQSLGSYRYESICMYEEGLARDGHARLSRKGCGEGAALLLASATPQAIFPLFPRCSWKHQERRRQHWNGEFRRGNRLCDCFRLLHRITTHGSCTRSCAYCQCCQYCQSHPSSRYVCTYVWTECAAATAICEGPVDGDA